MEKKIYEAPQAEVVEIYTEGVFCISTQDVDAADWQRGNYDWFE